MAGCGSRTCWGAASRTEGPLHLDPGEGPLQHEAGAEGLRTPVLSPCGTHRGARAQLGGQTAPFLLFFPYVATSYIEMNAAFRGLLTGIVRPFTQRTQHSCNPFASNFVFSFPGMQGVR